MCFGIATGFLSVRSRIFGTHLLFRTRLGNTLFLSNQPLVLLLRMGRGDLATLWEGAQATVAHHTLSGWPGQ